MSKDRAIHDYINYEDLLEKSGYWQYKPRFGTLGQELIKTGNQGSIGWLKNQLDSMFKKIRQNKFRKRNKNKNDSTKQNSRHYLLSNVTDHTKECSSSSTKSDGCTTDR